MSAPRAFHRAPSVSTRPARLQRTAVRAQAAATDALTLKIKLKAYEVPILEEAVDTIRSAVGETAEMSGTVRMPTRRRIYCVLRSPHVNSNSREHFEIRTHQRLLHVKNLTQEAMNSLLTLKLPAGVDCNVRI